MEGIDDTKFNPRVIIFMPYNACHIHVIYNVAASFIGCFYIGSEIFSDPSGAGGLVRRDMSTALCS